MELDYAAWIYNQPDGEFEQNCLCFDANYDSDYNSWRDLACDDLHYPICKAPLQNLTRLN